MKSTRVSPWTAALAALGGLAAVALGGARDAAAEVLLIERNGWQVFTEGRIGAFANLAAGKDAPMGVVSGTFGSDSDQADTSGDILAFRVRSGLFPNIFAVGFRRPLTETTVLRGYLALWASADTNRVKYHKSSIDMRQGFLQLAGPWGSFLAGRTIALFSRGNFEVNVLYQHGYGLGHPCKIDSYGEESGFTGGGSCGHIGFGVLHPSYDAGFVYATPSLGGLTVSVGLYDPVGSQSILPRTPYPRPEAEVAFEHALGDLGRVKVFSSVLWQRSQQIFMDPTTMLTALVNRDAWGVAGGARLELGPMRVGATGWTGKGMGTHVPLHVIYEPAALNMGTLNYRRSEGFYGALAGVFGRFMPNVGFGMAQVHLLPEDMTPGTPSTLPRRQYGVSAGINVRFTDALIFDVDFFRAHSEWWNRQSQDVNFASCGLTMVW